MKRKIRLAVTIIAALFLVTELVLRLFLGLGNPPLYEKSNEYGYRFLPNQHMRRFGNRIAYNAQGLRSEKINALPPDNTVRILCVGDSITNGGALTDQAKTYPYFLESILKKKPGKSFEVLNASASGWGIQNEEAYLDALGAYASRFVILQISGEDLFQPKSASGIVGCSPDFPARKPFLALGELFSRYLPKRISWLRLFKQDNDCSQYVPSNRIPEKILEDNIKSLERIKDIVRAKGAVLLVIFISQPYLSDDNDSLYGLGKAMFFSRILKMHIPYLDLTDKFASGGSAELLRDAIHPNAVGNRLIAAAAAAKIIEIMQE